MARSRKSGTANSDKAADVPTGDAIADAEIVGDPAPDQEAVSPDPDEAGGADVPDDAPSRVTADTVTAADDASMDAGPPRPDSDVVIEDDRITVNPTSSESEPEPEVQPGAGAEPSPPEQAASTLPQPVVVQKSGPGIIPLLIGGVVAAGLGFAAARYGTFDTAPDTALSDTVAAQAERIASLEASLADVTASLGDLTSRPDPESAIVALREELLAAVPATTVDPGALEAMQARIDSLAADLATATQSAGAAASGLTEDQMAAFRAELEAAVGSARAEIAAAQDRAAEIEAQAAAAAERAAAEAAFAQLAAALDSGSPYEALLGPIAAQGAEIPGALSEPAATGVPTMATLQMTFPDAARAALDGAIDVGAADSATDRVLAFLRTQTNARSLTPRDGDDPDAILSRAEEALRNGDLEGALGEVGGLPDAGRAAMADWIAQAQMRQAALAALTELRATIETE